MPSAARLLAVLVLAAALGVTPLAQDRPAALDAHVADLLARARVALGGEARLSAVRTVRLRGSVTRGRGHDRKYGHFEFVAELPASFVWTEHVPSLRLIHASGPDDLPIQVESSPYDLTIHGIDLGRLIHPVAPERGVSSVFSGSSYETDARRSLWRARVDFLRVTLGMFAASFEAAPVTFEPVTQGVDSLQITDTGPVAVLTFDPATHRPARYGDVTYDDYRDVKGVMVPHRVTEARAGYESVWRVERAEIDVPLPRRVFKR